MVKIGAQEVIDILRKHKKIMTSVEIAELVEESHSCVKRVLRDLRKEVNPEIKFKKQTPKEERIRIKGKFLNVPVFLYWIEIGPPSTE